MRGGVFNLRLGTFRCAVVSDGSFTYAPPLFPPPANFLFVNAPAELVEAELRAQGLHPEGWTEWISSYDCLLVETGEHTVLVDAGAGDLGPSSGRLLGNLEAVGIGPEDIDCVILTHAHPDHVGGIVGAAGSLDLPAARYFISREEWEFWTSPEAEARIDEHAREVLIGYARSSLQTIGDRLELLEHDQEIVPGITTILVPGHTPGHVALRIFSEGQELLVLSDTVLHPLHLLQPEWYAAVDLTPDDLVESRKKLLTQAATTGALVLAFHFPFPGLGHVAATSTGWRWTAMPA